MTFNDFINDSVTIQGAVRISSFDGEGNETVHFEGNPEDDLNGLYVDADWGEREITFLFAIDNTLHIEIEDA
jgi:hypothetical protein